MNHVVCPANIITFQIATSLDKENSLGQEHPARIRKKMGEFIFFYSIYSIFLLNIFIQIGNPSYIWS